MAGIAGILKNDQHQRVSGMLEILSHRGSKGMKIVDHAGATIGVVFNGHEENGLKEKLKKNIFSDGPGFGHKTEVSRLNGKWQIYRDELGVAPMYYAFTEGGDLCFASEVKALMQISRSVMEVPPGCVVAGNLEKKHFSLRARSTLDKDMDAIANELFNRLSFVISRRITSNRMGAWLSGGLDSSCVAAIARPWLTTLHTFAGGLKDAPDLEFAREAAKHMNSRHHEVSVELDEMIRVLPKVIYHLESFDPLLVRSSIVNFLVARRAADFVEEVFSGEGGDEFFAGYHYLKSVPENELEKELIDIAGRLHNTALQRVDRCAGAHGLTAHVVFTDPLLFEFALCIPGRLKIKNGIEKWILRQAIIDLLPERILWRPKAKFWEGAGVGAMLSDYASRKITDSDFDKERELADNWIINSKEELFYYRIFREYYGKLDNFDWMGRTKRIPVIN